MSNEKSKTTLLVILLDAFSKNYLSKKNTPFLYNLAQDGAIGHIEPLFAFKGIETTLFRVIQEAVNNIAKHSHAKNTYISLQFKKNVTRVHIRDDGQGFDVEEAIASKDRPRGLGLVGMRERVASVNGRLDIQSHPGGGGTEIIIEIPLN